MDVIERRERIRTVLNPDTRMDYVSTLEGKLAWRNDGKADITIRYVPDRLILEPDALAAYLDGLADTEWSGLEHLATAILDDINNEVVARWVQVVVTASESGQPGTAGHSVMLEDRQPKWQNDALLSRLRLL